MNQIKNSQRSGKKSVRDILALTPMQEGMLFHYLKAPGSDLYFEQLCLDCSGEIDRVLFEKAWNFVVESNEMLRAAFQWEKLEHPIQIILKEHQLQPEYYDFSVRDASETQKLLEEVKDNDRRKKFNLRQPPFRVTLCKMQKNKYVMMISNHHILYDGWSNGIILKEFFDAYDHLSKGNQLINPCKTRFKEFVKWNQNPDMNIHKQEKFWENYLKGANHTSREFYIKKSLKRKENKNAGNYQLKLPPDMKENLEVFLKKKKITLAALLYSAWGILLLRYNNCEDVIFATTVSGRSAKIKEIENIVGLFINTLPLRMQTHHGENLSSFLSRMNHMLQTRTQFETTSLLNINEYLEKCYQENLFDSVMIIENYPLDTIMMQKNSALFVNSFWISGMTQYDLTVIVIKFDVIEVNITYNKELFDEKSISRLSNQFNVILDDILNHPGKMVSETGVVSEYQRKQILSNLNRIADQSRESEYKAPVNEIQEKLVETWSDLLRVDKNSISIEANFFEFGGHSLKAIRLAERIHQEMNIKVPLVEIFRSPTIIELSQYIMESAEEKFVHIAPVEKKEYYPLSPAQKRLYVLQQVDPESIAYNGPTVLNLEGQIDKDRIEKTFKKLITRHESLRTSFKTHKGEPRQKIHDEVEFKIEYYDMKEVKVKEERSSVNRKRLEGTSGLAPLPKEPAAPSSASQPATDLISSFIRPFDLSQAPLLRMGLRKIQDLLHILVADMHHIITDGTSMEIFRQEFFRLYHGKKLPLLRIQYKDFSQWQNNKIISGEMKRQQEYWLNRFEGNPPVLRLPIDYPRPMNRTYEGDTIVFEIPHEEAEKLREMAKRENATLFMVGLAIFNILLYKITNRQDIVVGTITTGRTHANIENIIGFFVNTLVLRNQLKRDQTFLQFLREVRIKTLEAFDNQDYQFDDLVEKVIKKRETGRNPLFDALFTFGMQNIPGPRHPGKPPGAREPGLKVRPFSGAVKNQAKFDLIFSGQDRGNSLSFAVVYTTELFKKTTVEKFIEFFKGIVSTVSAVKKKNEFIKIKDINISQDLEALASEAYEIDEIEFEL